MIIQEFRTYPVFRIQSGGNLKSGLCYQSKALVVKKNEDDVVFYYLPINGSSQPSRLPVDVFVQSVEICLNQPKKRKDQTHFERINWPELSPIEDVKAEYNYRKDLEHIKFGLHRQRAWVTDYVYVHVIASIDSAKKESILSSLCSTSSKCNYPTASQTFRLLGEKDSKVFFRFSETARKAQIFLLENRSIMVNGVSWDFPIKDPEITESILSEIVHDSAHDELVSSLHLIVSTENFKDKA